MLDGEGRDVEERGREGKYRGGRRRQGGSKGVTAKDRS